MSKRPQPRQPAGTKRGGQFDEFRGAPPAPLVITGLSEHPCEAHRPSGPPRESRVRRLLARVGIAIAALIAAGAIVRPAAAISGPIGGDDGDRGTVAVIGDSITAQSKGPLREALERSGWNVTTIDADWGRATHEKGMAGRPAALDTVEAVVANSDPDWYVVAIGTNDAGYADPATYPERIQAILTAIDADDKVLWMTAYEAPGASTYAGRQDEFDTWNAALRDAADRDPRVAVVDWSWLASQPGILADDGVHVTDFGAQARANWTAQALTFDDGYAYGETVLPF